MSAVGVINGAAAAVTAGAATADAASQVSRSPITGRPRGATTRFPSVFAGPRLPASARLVRHEARRVGQPDGLRNEARRRPALVISLPPRSSPKRSNTIAMRASSSEEFGDSIDARSSVGGRHKNFAPPPSEPTVNKHSFVRQPASQPFCCRPPSGHAPSAREPPRTQRERQTDGRTAGSQIKARQGRQLKRLAS